MVSYKKRLDKYLQWVKMGVKCQTFYTESIIDKILGFIVQFIVLYFLWKAIYANSASINGRTFSEMVTYIALSITITSLYISPTIYFISEDIKSGNIVYLLIKPADYQLQFISKQVGTFIFMSAISFPILIIFHSIFLKVLIPANTFYFIISLVLGLLTVASFDYMLGILCFWTENNWGVIYFQRAIIEILSGTLIPLDFFPKGIREVIINYLPFQGIVYTPIQLFQNQWTLTAFLRYFIFQSVWISIFIFTGRMLFNKARKGVLINGG